MHSVCGTRLQGHHASRSRAGHYPLVTSLPGLEMPSKSGCWCGACKLRGAWQRRLVSITLAAAYTGLRNPPQDLVPQRVVGADQAASPTSDSLQESIFTWSRVETRFTSLNESTKYVEGGRSPAAHELTYRASVYGIFFHQNTETPCVHKQRFKF